jgi:hypothetical protein
MSSTPDENGATVAPMPEPKDTPEVTEPTEGAKVNGDISSPVDTIEEPTEEAGSGGEGGGDEAAEEVAVETNGEPTEQPAEEAVTETIGTEQPAEIEATKVPEEPVEDDSSHLLSYLQEARTEQESEDKSGLITPGPTFKKFQSAASIEAPDATPDRPPSSVGSYSTPDDTPSLRVCISLGPWISGLFKVYGY